MKPLFSSRLRGHFTGWHFDDVYILDNGSTWKLVQEYCDKQLQYRPAAHVYSCSGRYYLEFEDAGPRREVHPVTPLPVLVDRRLPVKSTSKQFSDLIRRFVLQILVPCFLSPSDKATGRGRTAPLSDSVPTVSRPRLQDLYPCLSLPLAAPAHAVQNERETSGRRLLEGKA